MFPTFDEIETGRVPSAREMEFLTFMNFNLIYPHYYEPKYKTSNETTDVNEKFHVRRPKDCLNAATESNSSEALICLDSPAEDVPLNELSNSLSNVIEVTQNIDEVPNVIDDTMTSIDNSLEMQHANNPTNTIPEVNYSNTPHMNQLNNEKTVGRPPGFHHSPQYYQNSMMNMQYYNPNLYYQLYYPPYQYNTAQYNPSMQHNPSMQYNPSIQYNPSMQYNPAMQCTYYPTPNYQYMQYPRILQNNMLNNLNTAFDNCTINRETNSKTNENRPTTPLIPNICNKFVSIHGLYLANLLRLKFIYIFF